MIKLKVKYFTAFNKISLKKPKIEEWRPNSCRSKLEGDSEEKSPNNMKETSMEGS